MADNSISFLDVCKDVTKTATKIPTTDYLPIGKYKIFDQGKDYIGGFRDSAIGLASDVPYILFGDHTRIIKYIDEPCFIGADGVKLLKVKDSRYTSKYIYYAMKAQPIESQGYARHFKFLKEHFYKYTTIEKQQKIVAELDNIESGIRVKQEQLKALDELIQSRFTEMFGQPQVNSKFSPNYLWNDVVVIKNGKDHKKKSHPTGLYPVYGSGGYMGIRIDEFLCNENSVIIGRKGNIETPLFVKEKYWNVDTAFGIETKSHILNPIYFYHRCFFYDFSSLDTGATIPSLTKSKLLNLSIEVPPLPLQNQFAEFVQKVERAKEIVKIQIKDLQELLAIKMDEYFK